MPIETDDGGGYNGRQERDNVYASMTDPIHEFDENGRPLMSAAQEEENCDYETISTWADEPRANKVLRYIRNAFTLVGGWMVGVITIAHPDDSPAGKMAQAVWWVGIVLGATWIVVGLILEWKRAWNNRGVTERPSTYEGE